MPLSFALASALALVPASPDDSAAPAPCLERVAVLGASVSDGFGLNTELGLRLGFADVLEAALTQPGELTQAASTWFFRDPRGTGRELQEQVLASEPTLVVAVDFLFWFGYGHMSDERRAGLLEEGLALLDAFDCPILVGDFPDMTRAAIEGTSPLGVPLLAPGQVPSAGSLARLNERLAAWAAERERVALVPLAAFVEQVNSGAAIDLRGNQLPGDESARLMQADLLHPTLEGTSYLAALVLDRLVSLRPAVSAAAVRWDVPAIRVRIEELHAKELEKVRERARKREERRRKREDRRHEQESEQADDASEAA